MQHAPASVTQTPATRPARKARAALSVYYAASRGWIDRRPTQLTAGLRDAYEHGLGIAAPVAEGVLGWAMDP